jgi:hypothetical protein
MRYLKNQEPTSSNRHPLRTSNSWVDWVSGEKGLVGVGDGAYSQVYKVRRLEDGQVYALKKVKLNHLSDKEKENAINEVRILASVNNVNVISYKEAFIESASQSIWYVIPIIVTLQHCDGVC